MNSTRVWLFRGLVIVAAGLMMLSWFLPWWQADIVVIKCWVQIHPWGLGHNLGAYTGYLVGTGAEMPDWFAPLIWTYLGICIVALLSSLLVKAKAVSLGKFTLSLPQVIIGGVGLSYIVMAVTAVIFAAIRTGDFSGMHLIGYSYFNLGGEPPVESDVNANLLFGYWLACAVGPLFIILALLRDKIVGKSKPEV